MKRVTGQTGTEYMLVISAVVIAVVGSSFVFVPKFREGTRVLGGNVRHILSTGSFAGLGLVNATVHDAATSSSTMEEGGDDNANNGQSQQVASMVSAIPFLDGVAASLEKNIQESQLAEQADGEKPPTGIDGNVCGIWALSYIMSEAGMSGNRLEALMAIAKDSPGVLMSDDYRIDKLGMDWLADEVGLNSTRTSGKDFPASKEWLGDQLEKGQHPAVLVNKNGQPHWMVVTGEVKDDTGRVTGYTFQDSTTDEQQSMTAADFQVAWAEQGNVGIAFDAGAPVATR